MTRAVLDDHLLRDLLSGDLSGGLTKVLSTHEPATTNLYLYRLSRSAIASAGGALTGSWSAADRERLALVLLELPQDIEVVPMRDLAFRMAQLAGAHRLSTLGAEAVAATEHFGGTLCVWSGDDGPGIRAAVTEVGGSYLPVTR